MTLAFCSLIVCDTISSLEYYMITMTDSFNSAGMQNKSCTTSFELCARRWAPVAIELIVLHANISCVCNVAALFLRRLMDGHGLAMARQQMISTRSMPISWWSCQCFSLFVSVPGFLLPCRWYKMPGCGLQTLWWLQDTAWKAEIHGTDAQILSLLTQLLNVLRIFFAGIGLYLFTKSVHVSCLVILVGLIA